VLLCALLGSIHATAEIADAAEADGSLPSEEIRTIKEISLRASGIVRQLMIYAGHEASDIGFVDLSRLVTEMLDLIRIPVSKSAALHIDLATDLPAVRGNAAQIQQAVTNLVLNASDALDGRAGVNTVRTSRVAAAERSAAGSACAATESDYVNLEVSDTGPGISREAQAKIFDPFLTTKSSGRLSRFLGSCTSPPGSNRIDQRYGSRRNLPDLVASRECSAGSILRRRVCQ
jgi:signal transduction histidine kinase